MTTLLHHFRANLCALFVALDVCACEPHVLQSHLSDAVLRHDVSMHMIQKFAVQNSRFFASRRTGSRADLEVECAALACLAISSMATPASVRVFLHVPKWLIGLLIEI